MNLDKIAVPKCGESDKRNTEYENNYTPKKFFKSILKTNEPVILDVGAHKGASIKFFKEIFVLAKIYSFEPCPQAENFS
jgi:hypothetical protein